MAKPGSKKALRQSEGGAKAEAEEVVEAAAEDQPKKRRKTEASAGEGPQKSAAPAEVSKEVPAADGKAGKKKNKNRKKKKNAETGEHLSAEDAKRKEAQKEIQQLVVRLRAEGKSDREIKEAKEELKQKHGPLRKPDGRKETKLKAWREKQAATAEEWKEEWKEEWTEGQDGSWKDERQKGLEHKHDLVIIPVIWRGRHDKLDVQKVADDLKAVVQQQGVDVWVDSRRQYTPGQKFAHWEHRGVMLRIEVGPDDVSKGVCRVCRAKTPGDYQTVERKSVKLPPSGARSLLLLLKEWGLSQIEVERRPQDDASDDGDVEEYDAKAAGAKADAAEETVDAEDPEGNWAPRVSKKVPKDKPKKGSKRKQ